MADPTTVAATLDVTNLIYLITGIIISIIAISSFVTAQAVKSVNRATSEAVTSVTSSATDMKNNLKENMDKVRDEFKELREGVDDKIDGFYLRVDQKVESVKTNVRDVQAKTDKIGEALHELEREFLQNQTKLQIHFVPRREFDEYKDRNK